MAPSNEALFTLMFCSEVVTRGSVAVLPEPSFRRPQPAPGIGDILPDLLHQLVGVRELQLAAQPLDEGQPEPLSIDITVEIEDMHLDADLAGGVEGGIRP